MIMWQEIAIILIGIAVVFYIGKKIYGFLKHPKTTNPCASCSGCILKEKSSQTSPFRFQSHSCVEK